MTYSSPDATDSDSGSPRDASRLRRRLVIAVVLLVLLLGGLFGFRMFMAMQGGMPGMMGGGPGVPVMSETPRRETISGKVVAVGTLRADQSISIAPEVNGRIAAIVASEGQAVKKGDVLVRLSSTTSRAALAEAEAALALAQATYDRRRNLAKSQFATRQSEDEALASLRAAQARVDSAKSRFKKDTILAPFDGVLGLRAKSVGAYLRAGDVIFPLTSVDPIFADFRVPELESARVKMGQSVTVSVPALNIDHAGGIVVAADPALEEAGRSLAVRARLPNPDGRLRGGMFAHVTLETGAPRGVLVIPERAIQFLSDGAYVYRAVDGKAGLAKVTISGRRVGEVEISDGIGPDDEIITDGQIKLQPGAPVMLLSRPNLPPEEMKKPARAGKAEPERKTQAPAPEPEPPKPLVQPGAAADAPTREEPPALPEPETGSPGVPVDAEMAEPESGPSGEAGPAFAPSRPPQ